MLSNKQIYCQVKQTGKQSSEDIRARTA